MSEVRDENLFLEDWVVVDYLGGISDYTRNSKYIELLIGLSLVKFCERQFGGKCWLGLEIKDKYKREIPKHGMATIKELHKIILKKVEENTPVDFMVALKPGKDGISRGMNFQLKRFGKSKHKQNTQSLIDFLDIDCRKYSKTKTILIVLIESPEDINLMYLQKSINTDNYPFNKIILIGVSDNKYINFYGIWPESGHSRFNLETSHFDY